jgi:hypothetical protein
MTYMIDHDQLHSSMGSEDDGHYVRRTTEPVYKEDSVGSTIDRISRNLVLLVLHCLPKQKIKSLQVVPRISSVPSYRLMKSWNFCRNVASFSTLPPSSPMIRWNVGESVSPFSVAI